MAVEHRAIVFALPRKQAQSIAKYLKAHESASEVAFAVDTDSLELIIMAKGADEEDNLVFDGVEDMFDIEDEEIEIEVEEDEE